MCFGDLNQDLEKSSSSSPATSEVAPGGSRHPTLVPSPSDVASSSRGFAAPNDDDDDISFTDADNIYLEPFTTDDPAIV